MPSLWVSSASPVIRSEIWCPPSARVTVPPILSPVAFRNLVGTTAWPGPVNQLPEIIW